MVNPSVVFAIVSCACARLKLDKLGTKSPVTDNPSADSPAILDAWPKKLRPVSVPYAPAESTPQYRAHRDTLKTTCFYWYFLGLPVCPVLRGNRRGSLPSRRRTDWHDGDVN